MEYKYKIKDCTTEINTLWQQQNLQTVSVEQASGRE